MIQYLAAYLPEIVVTSLTFFAIKETFELLRRSAERRRRLSAVRELLAQELEHNYIACLSLDMTKGALNPSHTSLFSTSRYAHLLLPLSELDRRLAQTTRAGYAAVHAFECDLCTLKGDTATTVAAEHHGLPERQSDSKTSQPETTLERQKTTRATRLAAIVAAHQALSGTTSLSAST